MFPWCLKICCLVGDTQSGTCLVGVQLIPHSSSPLLAFCPYLWAFLMMEIHLRVGDWWGWDQWWQNALKGENVCNFLFI